MWNYIVTLFHRSLHNHPLSPRERAFLKSMQGVLIGFVVDAAPQLLAVAGGHAKFNITNAAVAALIGALVAYVLKLWQSQGDANLAALLDAYAKAKEREALGGLTVPSADGSVSVPALQLMLPLVQALAVESHVSLTPPQTTINTAPPASVKIASSPDLVNNQATEAMPVSTAFPLPGTSIHDLPTANVPAVNPTAPSA
jgi:hypothetical protein